ncbi:DUF3108 domain-containing protein [Stappia taiwanensis]|uniref:DUF3108 domain-containing protein n=1 Tax=Stappia taiwanensis TaxID=992267 RepID=A0A838XXB3_9HYPH|nr:DUF3108 domain-containing protein [Stappia taiwanensis]MBA4611430.1 DUF3108 domain-containing protein [Stappia taiwanensis]GGF00368.1 hypothetical protein GCM10007285_29950 [Stappia taiwanensis]
MTSLSTVFTRLARSSLPVLAGVSALVLAQAPFARAETAKLGGVYDISVSGLKIARGSLSLVVQSNAYSAKVVMEPAGIGTLFSTGKGGAEASGWLGGKKVRPARYKMASRAANRDFFVDLAQGSGRVRSMRVTPKFKPNAERIKVTARHKRNVVDPLSAILMPAAATRGAPDASVCKRRIPVFDGWTRFDIQLEYKEMREVSGKGYDGQVVVCSARWIPVAGHRPSRASVKYMKENRRMEAWLAPIGSKGVFVPYRVEMATKNGTLVVQPRKLRFTGGRDQAAR